MARAGQKPTIKFSYQIDRVDLSFGANFVTICPVVAEKMAFKERYEEDEFGPFLPPKNDK